MNILVKNTVRLAEVWMDDYKHIYYERINNKLVGIDDDDGGDDGDDNDGGGDDDDDDGDNNVAMTLVMVVMTRMSTG